MFAAMTDVGSTRRRAGWGWRQKREMARERHVERYHPAGSTRLNVMDGLGEEIETDRIGAEGRLCEDKNGDEEVDKERDSIAAKRLLDDDGRMARGQPTSSGSSD